MTQNPVPACKFPLFNISITRKSVCLYIYVGFFLSVSLCACFPCPSLDNVLNYEYCVLRSYNLTDFLVLVSWHLLHCMPFKNAYAHAFEYKWSKICYDPGIASCHPFSLGLPLSLTPVNFPLLNCTFLQISGIAATITYVLDAFFKIRELRRKLRAERIASSDDDAKVEEPFFDEVQSPTGTVVTTVSTDEPQSPTTDWTNRNVLRSKSFLFLLPDLFPFIASLFYTSCKSHWSTNKQTK